MSRRYNVGDGLRAVPVFLPHNGAKTRFRIRRPTCTNRKSYRWDGTVAVPYMIAIFIHGIAPPSGLLPFCYKQNFSYPENPANCTNFSKSETFLLASGFYRAIMGFVAFKANKF